MALPVVVMPNPKRDKLLMAFTLPNGASHLPDFPPMSAVTIFRFGPGISRKVLIFSAAIGQSRSRDVLPCPCGLVDSLSVGGAAVVLLQRPGTVHGPGLLGRRP